LHRGGPSPMNLSMKKPAPVDSLAVVVVEDDDETRESIERSIGHRPGLRLAGSYARGRDALAALLQSAPDVLLVDLGLPDMSGLEIIRFAARHCPRCDVLVLTTFGDEEHVIAALEAGARGYLLKEALVRDIAVEIDELREGGSPLSPVIARQLLKRLNPKAPATDAGTGRPQGDDGSLTPREVEILRTISRGFSYAETADLLGISVLTVHTHLKNVYRKLSVHSMTEAVYEAGQRKLL